MNMMKNDKFELDAGLEQDAAPQGANPVLAQMMKAWESKNARAAKRAGGFGLMAVSLAACGGSGSGVVSDGTTPVEDGGIWSLIAGGLQLAGSFDPEIFAGGILPDDVLTGDPSVLTPTSKKFVNGEGNPAGGDDLVLASSASFTGAVIDLGGGEDTVFIDVTGSTIAGLVTNVETVELANSTLFGTSLVNLSTVVDIENVIISETSAAGGNLQVTNIRNTADIEVQGNFNNNVFIDFLNATGPLNLTVNDYFQNSGSLNIAQDFTAINLTSAGEGTLNAIDSGALGDNLLSLTIDGTVDFEIIGGAVAFRPNTPAVIEAGGFEGDNLTLTVAGHNNVFFTGSDADNSLSVAPALASVGTGVVITLTADFGGGDNTLTVRGNGSVTPETTIVRDIADPADPDAVDGSLTLLIATGAVIDMTQVPDLEAVTSVVIGDGATLNLTAAQVDQIGIENFSTPDFGFQDGALNITGVDDTPLDLSGIGVGQVVNIITVPGDVVLDSSTILGNANAGVAAVIVDNRGTDSTVTMTAEQFQQLQGPGTVKALGGNGTNNPATGEPFETGLVLTDLDPDTAYNLVFVSTDTTDVQLNDFTAGADFAITGATNTDLTLTLSGDVDLTEGNINNIDTIVFADEAVFTDDTLNNSGFDLVIEGAATINVDTDATLDTDNIEGDASQVTINFEGTGAATLTVQGSNDITLKAVNTGDDITSLTIENNLDAGATLVITGGSPAMDLGEDTLTLTIDGDEDTTTLIGTDPDHPDIVSSTLTTINSNPLGGAVINLGSLDGITSATLTVNGTNDPTDDDTGTTTVEIGVVPAGAAWVFNGVELVINDVSDFGAGATIKLGPNTTLSGDATIADIAPFLTSDSIVPLDNTSTAAEIDTVLQSLQADQATVNVTDMTLAQLEAVINNSLKVETISGDLVLTSDLSVFQINTLSGLYTQGTDDVLTINAAGMTTAQKEDSGLASVGNTTTVLNLTLDSDDSVATIGQLLPNTANNSTVVEATDMSAAQLNALVPNMPKVQVINDMTLTSGNSSTQITALLSKAEATAPDNVTVDAEFMGNAQFAAIVEQIAKIEVVENLTVSEGTPAEEFQLTALLELAVDAQVNALDMSDARLSIVAENIANIADDGITNLTVTANQTDVEIAALMGKAPDGTVIVDLSDMDGDQVAAVVAAADKVSSLTVDQNSTVTLTLAEFNALEAALPGLTPLLVGTAASASTDEGGSITIVANANGTLDLSLVAAGAGSAVSDDNGGTLTLQIEAGVTLSVEGAVLFPNENLAVTGTGTLAVTDNLDLSDQNLSVAAGITIDLAAAETTAIELKLTPEQADALAVDGVTITKAATDATLTEEGKVVADAGFAAVAGEPLDLSDLDLSLVDVLVLQENDRTILPGSAAALPAQIGTGFTPTVMVAEDTDWSAYTGNIQADLYVEPDATVTVSAAVADQMRDDGVWIIGVDASADGETGGSIVITGLENGEIYDLTGTLNPGDDGGFAANAGTLVVSIPADVTLDPATILPATATIEIDAGATLTVNGGTAAQVNGTNDYEGLGTLNFVDLDGHAVTADAEVRFNTFTFEATDTAVTINGFEAIDVGGFNGQFLFDNTTTPDTLGTMSLDLSAFTTNGADVIQVAGQLELDALGGGDIVTAGVIIINDGTDPALTDFGTLGGDVDSFFFVSQSAPNTTVIQYWEDVGDGAPGTANDGIVQAGELITIATLNATTADQLGNENFTF